MKPMRPLSISAKVSLAIFATSLALMTTACDQLNRPLGKPSSSSSSSGSSAAGTDGGDGSNEGGSPAPTITAQPGDIQL
ncbi:MAG: hypothetical protein BGO98_04175 [Myxococcales bacterium 68-20]|nr:MAG: hypothetical protein BGO98_04175 [Myxococcales bacterium 68-20]